MNSITTRAPAAIVSAALTRIRRGSLLVDAADGRREYAGTAGHDAVLRVHDERFYRRVLLDGEVGLGDAYMDGWWSSPDLIALIRLMLANRDVLTHLPAWLSWLSRARVTLAHYLRDNTRAGSRRNIHEHYDLGNDFFKLFLDPNLLYSCAIFQRADESLEAAQVNKLRVICDRLELRPHHRVLEIGTGWGGFAVFAATRYGCHVTTTTISAEQHAYARALFDRAGDAGRRIDLKHEDYRDLTGRFDRIVSIEMFEAVGLKHYDDFFSACDRLLADHGAMLMQTITVDDWRFDDYLSSPSWIARRIFPGAELASVARVMASVGRVTSLGLHHAAQIGPHYAPTLREWRARFHNRIADVRAQGFDDRFIRMWDLYLAFCEAAFADRHIGNVHLTFAKPACRLGVRDVDTARGDDDDDPGRQPSGSAAGIMVGDAGVPRLSQ